ncbi:MAG: disulfide bond formation protein B [Burkholderiaceae bacterium]
MKTSKPLLLAIAIACVALLGFGLYLQFAEHMLPCPLCIMQRYAFIAVALICLITLALPRGATQMGSFIALLAALAGAGIAGWHLWIKAHPGVSCGIDPMETALNKIPTAKWLPFLLKADGFCSTEYEPILGLSIPQWSLAWFLVFALVLVWIALKRKQ